MKYNRWQNGGKVKSQRLINALLEAKRENPSITTSELNYLAQGFKAYNRG
jgi:hypothetical protein